MMKSETAEDGKEKIKEKKVKIKFTKLESGRYAAKGEGVNKFGEFDLSGTFNPEDGKMACTKIYRVVEESDEEDSEDGMDDELDQDELADLQADAQVSS